MTISGFGQYVTRVNNEVYPICLASFVLTPRTQTRPHFGQNYSTGISTPQHSNIISAAWEITLDSSVFDAASFQILTSVFNIQNNSHQIYTESVYDGLSTLPEAVFNLSRPDIDPQQGDIIGVISGTVNKPVAVDDSTNVSISHEFYGIIFEDGAPLYTVQIDKMRRTSGVQFSVGSNTTATFITDVPLVRSLNVNQVIGYAVLFADPADQYTSGSSSTFYGRLISANGQTTDPTTVPITMSFPFAQDVTVTPDVNGFFTIPFDVQQGFDFPQTAVFTLTDDLNNILYEKEISVRSPNEGFDFTASASVERGGADATVSGTAAPASVITFASTNLSGAFNGSTTTTRLNGTFSLTERLPDTVGNPTSWTITVSTDFEDDIPLAGTINKPILTFNPELRYE